MGATFGTFSELVLGDPTGKTKAKIAMSVGGEPPAAVLGTYTPDGKNVVLSGGGRSPVFRAWDPVTGEEVFAK